MLHDHIFVFIRVSFPVKMVEQMISSFPSKYRPKDRTEEQSHLIKIYDSHYVGLFVLCARECDKSIVKCQNKHQTTINFSGSIVSRIIRYIGIVYQMPTPFTSHRFISIHSA